MLAEGGRLVVDAGGDIGDAGGPEGDEGGPGTPRLALDGTDGGHAGKVEQHEEQVGKGAHLTVEAGGHGTKDVHAHLLFGGHLGNVLDVRRAQAQRIGDQLRNAGQVLRHRGGRGLQFLPEAEGRLLARTARGLCRQPGIEGVQGAHHHLFGQHAGDDAHHRRPVVLVDAHGLEDRHQGLAGGAEHRVFRVLVAEGAVGADGVEHVEHQHHHHDHLARLAHEEPHPVPGAQQHSLEGGQVVGRQLHHEAGAFAPQQGALHHQPREHRHQDTDEIEREHQVLSVGRKEGRGEEHVHRQPRAAGHEGIHENGELALAHVLQRSGGHDRRHVAAEADDERNEGLAGQADGTHETIHDKGRPRHVARVLQRREKEVESGDDGNEGGDHLDAAADAVGQDHAQPVGGSPVGEQLTEPVHHEGAGHPVEEIDEGATDVDGEHEHQVHEEEENGNAQPAAQHHPVDAVREGVAQLATLADHRLGQGMGMTEAAVADEDVGLFATAILDHLAPVPDTFEEMQIGVGRQIVVGLEHLQRQPVAVGGVVLVQVLLQVGDGLLHHLVVRQRETAALHAGGHRQHARLEFQGSLAGGGHDGHHRAAQFLGELLHVDVDTALARHVHHVQGDDHGHTHLQQLHGQVEIALQVGGIHHVDDEVGLAGEQVVAGDLLVEGGCV